MKTLWEQLWNYDPNGLVVVNPEMIIQVVNPAFCRMFRCTSETLVGSSALDLLNDTEHFRQVWETGEAMIGLEREYPEFDLYVRKVIFPIVEENIIACIMVDLTHEWRQRREMIDLKRETILKINAVVDKQMGVAQKIAGLLGETTAETKVSLLKLLEMVEKGQV